MNKQEPRKRATAFTWAMIGFYTAFFGSSGYFAEPDISEIGGFILNLVFMGAMLLIILSIMRSPHIIDSDQTRAPGILIALGAVYFIFGILTSGLRLYEIIIAAYVLVGLSSMGILIGLYKKTGIPASEVKAPEVPAPAPLPAEPAKSPVDSLCESFSRASCFGSPDGEVDRAMRRCLQVAEGIRDKDLPVPEQTIKDMCRLTDAYTDLADDVVSTKKTRKAREDLSQVFLIMAEGLENIYDAGVLKGLAEAEAEAQVLEGQLRLSGFMNSDFEDLV